MFFSGICRCVHTPLLVFHTTQRIYCEISVKYLFQGHNAEYQLNKLTDDIQVNILKLNIEIKVNENDYFWSQTTFTLFFIFLLLLLELHQQLKRVLSKHLTHLCYPIRLILY